MTASGPSALRLPPDLLRVFRGFGIQFLHVAQADVAKKSVQSVVGVSESGELDFKLGTARVGMLAAADSSLEDLVEADQGVSVVSSLSPRRWDISWRDDDGKAVLVEVQYHDKRGDLTDAEASVVRLIAVAAIDLSQAAPNSASGVVSWPAVDRRARTKRSWAGSAILGLALAAVVLSGVLALRAAPRAFEALNAQVAQSAACKAMCDATLAHALSVSLATGDYGLVQSELETFHKLGYFDSAVVVSNKERVVAAAGQPPNARVGADVPAAYAGMARAMELAALGGRHGRLLVVSREQPAPASMPSLSPLGWAVWLVTLALAGLIARQILQRKL